MVYIVMGVSGCGKSTIAQMLADKLSIPFHDGDDYHPKANVDKMASGQALNDDDRQPWLELLAVNIQLWNRGNGAVLACSALKQKYRQTLAKFNGVQFIHLLGSQEVIANRMKARDHFMPPVLLQSQFDTLESPQDAWEYDIQLSPEQIIAGIKEKISCQV